MTTYADVFAGIYTTVAAHSQYQDAGDTDGIMALYTPDAVLEVPGKTSRPDTATRMAMDADLSDRRELMPHGLRRRRERDDGHLVKPTGSSADIDPLQELTRVVREAQERDAEDELRLYHPMRGDRPSSFQRRRPDRR